MNCFYHPRVPAVGTCHDCGRGCCRGCVTVVQGMLGCPECMGRAVHMVRGVAHQTIRKARSTLVWARVTACIVGLVAGFFALVYVTGPALANHPGTFAYVTQEMWEKAGGVALLAAYLWWAWCWGYAAVMPAFFRFLGRLGFVLFLTIPVWLGVIGFMMGVSIVYGALGGGFYQASKCKRLIRTLQAQVP